MPHNRFFCIRSTLKTDKLIANEADPSLLQGWRGEAERAELLHEVLGINVHCEGESCGTEVGRDVIAHLFDKKW